VTEERDDPAAGGELVRGVTEHRSFLVGLAYRMLGSVAEAEDVVQDAFVRVQGAANISEIREPRAYLARVVTHLCLDRLKSARAKREEYVGMWLPDPVVENPATPIAEDISIALMLALERLSPLERAAFLLHDVFDMDYAVVAKTLDRSEAACRQLAARAREHVRSEQPRYPGPSEDDRIVEAFAQAVVTGDVSTLATLLAEDAVFYSDGGGKKRAALNPILGRAKIVRFANGIRDKRPNLESVERVRINGLPGFVLHSSDGVETIAFEIADGFIARIYAIRNPDKLGHLTRS
jgi:RNA polymerase sigma-70 factor (ECF subfamily)